MNRINPLQIGALLIIILAFFIFKLGEAKNELHDANRLYKETLAISKELVGLREVYGDKNSIRKSINRILHQSSLRSAHIVKKVTSRGLKISSQSMDRRALNSLMGRVLNGSYNITFLKIKRLSDKSASLNIEIKW